MPDNPTRRRLLALGSVGLTSGLAGCGYLTGRTPNNAPNGPNPSDGDGPNTTEPDDTTPERPETPAGEIRTQDGDQTFTVYDLPQYTEWPDYKNNNQVGATQYPDTRVISVEVSEANTTVTVAGMTLNRDVIVSLHYKTASGSIETARQTVSSESDDFKQYQWTFNVSGSEFPRLTEANIEVTLTDSATGVERALKPYRFIAIPYENSSGSGVHYMNSPKLNDQIISLNHDYEYPRRKDTEVIDENGERTRFFVLNWRHGVVLNDGTHFTSRRELLGTYATISTDDYEEWDANQEDPSYANQYPSLTYAYNAEDFDYLTTFAETFATSLDRNGITDHFTRLEYLGYMVGCMAYRREYYIDPQFVSLYEFEAQCSEATFLYIALLNTSAFNNTRAAYILATFDRPGDHLVAGIDERDLGTIPDDRDIYWVEPTDTQVDEGVPDTRYAYTELTHPNKIGDRVGRVEVLDIVTTTHLNRIPHFREFP